jgi:hypothetical protein
VANEHADKFVSRPRSGQLRRSGNPR